MEYALLIYGDEKAWSGQDEDANRAQQQRHARFAEKLQAGNALRGGKQLALAGAATTLRHRGDDVRITDGPFAETSEVLGGFYLIEAADLDAAIAFARELPEGVVEIRPIAGM